MIMECFTKGTLGAIQKEEKDVREYEDDCVTTIIVRSVSDLILIKKI